MPRWLSRLLIWKGHLLLWAAAFIALFWLLLVLLLQLLASRPENLHTIAKWADAELEMSYFSAEARPLASAVNFDMRDIKMSWPGGRLSIASLSGDLNLWNLIWPDLAVGKQIHIESPVIELLSDDSGVGANPLASPWLRLWENTLIEHGQVVWQSDAPWTLDDISVRFSKQQRWLADFQGVLHYPNFPAIPLTAEATIQHHFGFHPQIHFSAQALPDELQLLGQDYGFRFDLNGDWNEEALTAALTVNVSDSEQLTNPIVHHVMGRVRSDDLRTWDVTIEQLVLAEKTIDLPVWPRLTIHPQTGALLTLNQVGLTHDAQWLTLMPPDVQHLWQRWQPELWLNQLSLHWRADGALDDIRGGVDLLRWKSSQGIPGMTLRQLTFNYDPAREQLQVIPMGDSQITWQTSAGQELPVTADPLVLRINPKKPFTDWSLPSWRVSVGQLHASVIADVTDERPMELHIDAASDNLGALESLLPLDLASQALNRWWVDAKPSGQKVQAQLNYRGPLTDLLAGELTADNFDASLSANAVQLTYDKAYPPLTDADVRLIWHPDRLTIQAAKGRILAAQITNAVADVLYLPNEQVALRVNGDASGDLSQIPKLLVSSGLAKELSVNELLKSAQFSGPFTGRLSLWLPLDGFSAQEKPRVRGVVHTQTGRFEYADEVFSDIKTSMLFSEQGVEATPLTAQWRRGLVKARITSDADHQLHVFASSVTPIELPEIAQGKLTWRGELKQPVDSDVIQFNVTADQAGVAIFLPEPFTKSQQQAGTWSVKGQWHQQQLNLSMNDPSWRVAVQAKRPADQWQLDALTLVPASSKPMVANNPVRIELATINGEEWFDWWGRLSRAANAPSLQLPEKGLLTVARMRFAEQTMHQLTMVWQASDATSGMLDIASPEVQGQVNWSADKIGVNLTKLLWRRHVNTVAEKQSKPLPICPPPQRQPWRTVQFTINRLLLETWREAEIVNTQLTNVNGVITQEGDVRSVKQLNFTANSLKGSATWNWDMPRNQSALFVKARAENAVDLTRLFGVDNAINGGSIDLDSLLSWQGGIGCFDNRIVSGSMNVRADDGTITDASPGFSRLLGLLSFDAFTRRLKIGLDDVMNQGLAFDKILMASELNKGTLTIKSLTVDSPSVKIDMQGTSDLVSETHQLRAQVTPLIGDSLPTMALLSGASPITAIGYYLLQKVIPPLSGNLLTLNYRITGSWKDPILDEVVEPPLP